MSLPNHFDAQATDGGARTGELTTPHGVVRTPAFMPVGTAGAMKGMHWREVRDAGSRYRARQHLPSDAAAGCGAHRSPRRPANLYRLERADADRFRRLPGDVAGRIAQAERERRHLPFAYRRRQSGTVAGAFDRGAAAARLRHRHAARRMRAAAGGTLRYRAGDAALAALGGALKARVRDGAARQHAVRHRAGRRRAANCARPARADWSRSAFTATRSAGLRSANRNR